jgi:hypothetical protein
MNLLELVLISFLSFFAYAENLPDYDNPYAPIFTDREIYTWTDKIRFTIIAPSWDENRNGIDSIGTDEGHLIKISTSEHSLEPYKLTETGTSSGVFTGEVILTGFLHDVDGDGKDDTTPRTFGTGPTNGFLETNRDEGITISFEFADGVVLTKSAQVSWNISNIRFSQPTYSMGDTATMQVFDPDMNLDPEGIDTVELQVSSISDKAGILVDAIETSEESGLFVASISFTPTSPSGGNRLFTLPGETIIVKYDDYTLPAPYSISDHIAITAESNIISDVPPIERISIIENFVTDSSGTRILEPTINDQLQIVAKVTNNQNFNQAFVCIIQIKNSKGGIESISWIQGMLTPNQDLEVAQSWNPRESGNYNVETFVWNSLSDAVPLSPIFKQSYFIE